MAGFLELIDNTLGTNFHAPVYDPKAGRKKMLRVIELAAKQHSEGTTRAPNRSWASGNNNAISFEPKIAGKPVLLAEQSINYVPAERFQDFLSGLKAAVEAGDLDTEIRAAVESDETEEASSGSSTGTRGGRPAVDKAAKFPKHLHPGYDELPVQVRRNLGRQWSLGRNPDGSLRSEVGDKPDAPYATKG